MAEHITADKSALSIVVPIFDEEGNIFPLYRRLCRACVTIGKPYELIFVDDGSRDNSFGLLKRLSGRDARVKIIRFRKNFGQTAAMAAGFEYAKGDVIVSMDGDLQNDPSD